MDRKLTWKEESLLKFHYLICGQCDCYHKQLQLIRECIQDGAPERTRLSEEARMRIKKSLQQGTKS